MGLKIKQILGEQKQDAFGYAVAIGDVNGDNKNELVVASTNGHKGATVTVFSSSFKAIKKIYIGKKKVNTIRLILQDMNNDNVDELIIAVTYQDLSGEVKIYSVKDNKFLFYWKSVEEFDAFGFSVGTGDVDGDGIKDIVIGAPQPVENGKGKVYVYSGKDGELLRKYSSIIPKEHSDFGTSIACGDINGDGIDEIIIGSPGNPEGEVLIYSGQYGWLIRKLTSDEPGYGIFVYSEDINDDGRHELIVTTKNLEGNKVSVYDGLSFEHLYDIENDEVDIGFGEIVTAGDINGDGVKELIIGAFDAHYKRKKYTGQVNVYDGKDGKLLNRWYGKGEKDQFGFSLTCGRLGSNDNKESVIIGAPREIMKKKGIVYVATIK